MTDLLRQDGPRSGATPYGWVGLPLSLVAILALGFALAATILAIGYAGDAVAYGWDDAAVRVSGLVAAAKGDPSDAEFLLLCLSILIYFTVAMATLGAARLRGGRAWRDLIGWHAWAPTRRLTLFLGVAAGTLAYSLLANEGLARFYPPSQSWVTLPQGPSALILFFVVAVVSAPLTEELIFRGWIYTALRDRLGLWPSLSLSSVLFALAHWEKTHLYALVVFPVGLALGYLRERFDSLKASIALHALFNGVACVLTLFGQ